MKIEAKSIEEYYSKVDEDKRAELLKLSELIQETIPEAEPVMFYGVPSFKVDGKYFASIAAQKQYNGLYLCYFDIVDEYRQHFAKSNLGKSCIRFKKADDLPQDVIKNILKDAKVKLIDNED